MTTLGLSPRARASLERHAQRSAPAEACGLLLGRVEDSSTLILRAPRLANTAPARDRFALCPLGWMRVERAARRLGLLTLGVWHTHPDACARPSVADLAGAWEGRPNVIVGSDGIRAWIPLGPTLVEAVLVNDPNASVNTR